MQYYSRGRQGNLLPVLARKIYKKNPDKKWANSPSASTKGGGRDAGQEPAPYQEEFLELPRLAAEGTLPMLEAQPALSRMGLFCCCK